MATTHQRITRLLQRAAIVLAALVALAAPPAGAATPEEAASGATNGIYVEQGAERVDTGRLEETLGNAREADLELTVVVLAEPADAVAFADSVNDLVPGTVLVFTPEAYGVSSTELAQATLGDALSEAADELSSPDVADGVAAFVAAATPSNTNWGLIVILGITVIAVVGVGGRVVERRATAGRRAAALQRRWAELETRTDLLASPVLDLSTRVELDGRPDLAERYRTAATQYGDLRDALRRDPSPDAVPQLEATLDELERRLDEIERELDDAGP